MWGKCGERFYLRFYLQNMATVNFLVKGKENPSTIFIRFRHGRSHDYTKSSGKLIDPKHWSTRKKAPLPRSTDLINLGVDLNDLSKGLVKKFNETNRAAVNGEWLERQIDILNGMEDPAEEKPESLSEFITDAIQHIIDTANTRENSKGGLGLSTSRINSYQNLKNIIEAFQGKKKLKIKDVDQKFGRDFMDWLINKRQYAESYARKKIDDLKTVCRDAEIQGIPVSPQLRKVKGGKTKNNYILYLSPAELKQIKEADLDSLALENARKWLLLGCSIGQRGGDLLKITKENFVKRNGLDVIELKQQKTGKQITIPILPTTREILQDGLPHEISIQRFNEFIKQVCLKAGLDTPTEGSKVLIPEKEKTKKGKNREKRKVVDTYPKWQLMTSHVCRRTFATNQYGILPTPLIMQITGHGTEKMFLNYIGKNSYDFAHQIAQFYNTQTNQ